MARLERVVCAGPAAALARGAPAMQSVRDGLEEMRRWPSMRGERGRRRGPGRQAPAARRDAADAAGASVKTDADGASIGDAVAATRAATRAASRTLSISDEHTKEPPETLLFSWGRGALLHDGDATASTPVAKFASRNISENGQRGHERLPRRVPGFRGPRLRRPAPTSRSRAAPRAPRIISRGRSASSACPSARASWPWPAARRHAAASRRRAACCAGGRTTAASAATRAPPRNRGPSRARSRAASPQPLSCGDSSRPA